MSHFGVLQVSLRVEEGCDPAELEQPPHPLGLPRLLTPRFRNESGQPVEVFGVSHVHNNVNRLTTLAVGDTFQTHFGPDRCDDETSYIVQAKGQEVARLDRPVCVGRLLVITPAMIPGSN